MYGPSKESAYTRVYTLPVNCIYWVRIVCIDHVCPLKLVADFDIHELSIACEKKRENQNREELVKFRK